VKEGVRQEVHRSQLRPHVEDEYSGDPIPLYYFSGKANELAVAPDEWLVSSVRGHRYDRKGNLEFLVEWQGCDPQDASWEPLGSFVTPNEFVMRYCQSKGLKFDLQHWWSSVN